MEIARIHQQRQTILEWRGKYLLDPHSKHTALFLKLASKPVKTGVRIEVEHPKRGWENFTIRDDYDFEHGERPSGKGYHVNVEAPSEKIAYCCAKGRGVGYVRQCWDHISERVSVDGDAEAARWYLKNKDILS